MVNIKAMVLQYEPELGCCRWVDFVSRHKTHATLSKALRAGVKRGEWHGYRLIRIYKEVLGNCEVGDDNANL